MKTKVSTSKKNSTKQSAEKPVAPAPAKKKKDAPVDAIGNRIGSQAAAINAAMTKEPQTVEEIAKKAKLSNARVASHMRYLINRKCAVRTDDGFSLKA